MAATAASTALFSRQFVLAQRRRRTLHTPVPYTTYAAYKIAFRLERMGVTAAEVLQFPDGLWNLLHRVTGLREMPDADVRAKVVEILEARNA